MPFLREMHKDYTTMLPYWTRCRDAKAGEDAVKAKGEVYLPRIGGQTDEQYNSYKMRGRFFNAFNKTLLGHVGLATRKPIILDQPTALEPISNNIDRNGSDVSGYLKSILAELLEVGRVITLIDYTKIDALATMQDAATARPYWIQYKAEDFIDWEYKDGQLIYGVFRELQETRGRQVKDEYQYRVCRLIDGVYTQEVYVGEENEPVETIIPQVAGAPMPFIPAIIHQTDYDTRVDLPPLMDLVNLCMSHYRLKADHAHALHYVALPTPWITGVDPDDENAPKTIGPQKAWVISNDQAKVGMLEFTGQGVKAIEYELKSMEDQMAIIGARILLPEVSENTATASTLRSLSETSDLASMIVVVERQANYMMDFTAQWAGTAGETEVKMDKHLIPLAMDASMVTAMVAAQQNGGFDYETLVDNFKRAEIISPEKTVDDLLGAIEEEGEARMLKAAEAMKSLTEAEGGEDEDEDNNTGNLPE